MHILCTSGLIRGLASPGHGEKEGREVEVEGGEVTGGQRKQAWGEETVQSPREVCESYLMVVVGLHTC